MLDTLLASVDTRVLALGWDTLNTVKNLLLVFIGFSAVVFVHELGHFLAAKWCDVRVDKFAVGFGKALFSWRRGIGFRWGTTHEEYRRRLARRVEENRGSAGPPSEKLDAADPEVVRAARELGLGETEYCFNALPLGGYVKMLGQEDFTVDKSGELRVKEDPRAFTHKPIRQRMLIISAGVVMNLVFAAVVFTGVFMIGMRSVSAEVGTVMPGSPADRAGLRTGDVITEINGRGISDRNDLITAVVLADPQEAMRIAYKRKDLDSGQVKSHQVEVRPQQFPGDDTQKLGVAGPVSTEIGFVAPDPDVPPEQQLQVGDVVLKADGQDITDFTQVEVIVATKMGEWVDLLVRRPPADRKGEPREVHARIRGRLSLGASPGEDGNLLGLVPRQVFNELLDRGAEPATALRRNDVIVRWGGILAPRMTEIRNSIRENPGKEIPVTVLRDGQEKVVTVKPRAQSAIRTVQEPLLTLNFWKGEVGPVVVADIALESLPGVKSPAAALKDIMPRGSRLTQVNDQPVQSWPELLRRFIELAGQDVKLTWLYEGTPEQSATIHVPQTLDTALGGLPPTGASFIVSINGVAYKEVEVKGRRDAYVAYVPTGQRAILQDFVGQNVPVEYEMLLNPERKTQDVTITPEMLVPWTRQFMFMTGDVQAMHEFTIIRERNPLKAMSIGIWKTYYFIEQVYLTMQRMLFTRSMSMNQVSGPVGIFKIGGEVADLGTVYLLYFLALISANLAVINFLPLPIVDGGLFVFLLIEWIKGRPVSLKVQVATQVIGLALIISIFVYVTFLDLTKF